MSNNEDFHVTIDGLRGNYTVEARGPREIQVSPVPFVYNETEGLREALGKIRSGYAPSRRAMKGIGGLLYDALFPRSVYRAWARSQAQLAEGGTLRLKLNVRPPELSRLPWEMLYDADEGYFLAVRLSYAIVRTIESGIPVASTLARHPLRVLYLQANPLDTAPLDLVASEKALAEALGADCEIKVVRHTTPDALMRVLRERSGFHILHYDGHARFDDATDEGHLALHSAKQVTHWLSGETLASLLDGSSVRLVVLAACQTGISSSRQRFAGIAQHLMHTSQLPAAVAMQFAIPDSSAICFTRHFYEALAADFPIEEAVVEGRKGMLASLRGSPPADWATPVLFMRGKDGNILRSSVQEEETTRQPLVHGINIGHHARLGDVFTGGKRQINTGGGHYIEGNVNMGRRDFFS